MKNIDRLNKILDEYQMDVDGDKNVDSKLAGIDNEPIILYGAGNIGKKLYKALNKSNINVECFLDKNTELNKNDYEVPVYYPDDVLLNKYKNTASVILSALFSKNMCREIRIYLNKLGFKKVYALHEINFGMIDNGDFYNNMHDGMAIERSEIIKERENIVKALNLLEIDDDRSLYVDYIEAHLKRNFTIFKEPYDVSLQYLAHDIEEKIDYSNFIDCGAFDGDTIKSFIENKKHMENVVVFEPQNHLCRKIYKYVNSNKDKINSVTIFPCGVGSKFEKVKFLESIESPSSSKVVENGDNVIQCVSIDEALHGFKPTFIKMDIEGAEMDALMGAKNTIETNHPHLAICVYHSLSDIWQVPLLIKKFYSGYRFYLRSYNYMGLETVLYAFPEK